MELRRRRGGPGRDELPEGGRETVEAARMMGRDTLFAQAGEEVVGRRDALAERLGHLVGADSVGSCGQKPGDLKCRSGGAQATSASPRLHPAVLLMTHRVAESSGPPTRYTGVARRAGAADSGPNASERRSSPT